MEYVYEGQKFNVDQVDDCTWHVERAGVIATIRAEEGNSHYTWEADGSSSGGSWTPRDTLDQVCRAINLKLEGGGSIQKGPCDRMQKFITNGFKDECR